MLSGTIWFKRLVKDIKKIDPYLRLVRAKMGFYRVYWKETYIHEIYKEAPLIGYTFEDLDPGFESQKYYEELEDPNEITRKIKNYKEGYWDSLDRIKTRVWMMRHDKEFNKNATQAYKQMVVK
mgnify:CR=1 FL=1